MSKDEVFIQVRPASMAGYVIHVLKEANCKITGEGGFIGEYANGIRDIWFTPPAGVHPDEFSKIVIEPK